ncbi:hypothetical protein [Celeribacter litoreus]|uniref:hypothetical protein n=1 Tax=Celeribacter litoreus TaxID=2876714 RepID=UPI001CCC7552|nr:hypothetical protein [Celeribacter litoreus]MCA0042264.1 hypothetical protein [Celeribacter litoreus]
MTDYAEKAREGRAVALSLQESGGVVFFPEGFDDHIHCPVETTRRVVTQMSKPLFVRSESAHFFRHEKGAGDCHPAPYLLSADLLVVAGRA